VEPEFDPEKGFLGFALGANLIESLDGSNTPGWTPGKEFDKPWFVGVVCDEGKPDGFPKTAG
jgi:hypothetical protein